MCQPSGILCCVYVVRGDSDCPTNLLFDECTRGRLRWSAAMPAIGMVTSIVLSSERVNVSNVAADESQNGPEQIMM
jgi:hypothetical protein